MIVDKTENMGEHAWTKLLDDTNTTGNGAVIVKMANNKADCGNLISDIDVTMGGAGGGVGTDAKESSPLTMDLLKPHCGRDKKDAGDVLASGVGAAGEIADSVPKSERKESLLGSFHRHLRRSLKAVSESPGPITR